MSKREAQRPFDSLEIEVPALRCEDPISEARFKLAEKLYTLYQGYATENWLCFELQYPDTLHSENFVAAFDFFQSLTAGKREVESRETPSGIFNMTFPGRLETLSLS